MAKKQGGLGRDFYSLFDDNMVGESKKSAAEMLRISEVEPRADQPRKTFERESLESLADSIAAHGVLQPIIVRENPTAEGTYEIIAGERRWRASKLANLTEIPAIVMEADALKAAEIAIIENELVEKKKWFSSDDFYNMLAIAESTPGPIAINMATFIGSMQAGIWGSVCATLGVVLPSFIISMRSQIDLTSESMCVLRITV